MKKLVLATLGMLLLIVVISACTDTTTENDQLYEQSTDKDKVKRPGDGD